MHSDLGGMLFGAGLTTLVVLAASQTAFLLAEGPNYTPLQKAVRVLMVASFIFCCFCFIAGNWQKSSTPEATTFACGIILFAVGILTSICPTLMLLSSMHRKTSFTWERRMLGVALAGMFTSMVGSALLISH